MKFILRRINGATDLRFTELQVLNVAQSADFNTLVCSRIWMAKKSPKSGSPIVQEHSEDAPVGWKETQEVLAAGTGLSLLLVEGRQPPAIVVSTTTQFAKPFNRRLIT